MLFQRKNIVDKYLKGVFKTHDPIEIANCFLGFSFFGENGRVFTNYSLHSLLYLAQGIHLEKEGIPLFDQDIVVRRGGRSPSFGYVIVPRVFDRTKVYGDRRIPEHITKPGSFLRGLFLMDDGSMLDSKEKRTEEFCYGVYTNFLRHSSYDLLSLINREGSPVQEALKQPGEETPIDQDLMRQYFRHFVR